MKSLRTMLSLTTVAGLAIFAAAAIAQEDPAVTAANSERQALAPIKSDDTARDPSVGKPERGGEGTLEITTRPAGGEVYFADDYRGKTPLSVKVPSGRNDLSIDLEGDNIVRMRVNVWPDKVTSLNMELKRPIGTLQITTVPGSASISLDGRAIGATKGSYLNIGRVKAGSHSICATAGGMSGCQTVNVPAEDTLKVQLKMKR